MPVARPRTGDGAGGTGRTGRPFGPPPADLSGGQRQRVAIARALICNPSVILADEPGNLDSATAHDIMTLLLDLNREHAVTLIMVTHDAGLASLFQRRLQVRAGQCLKPARRRSPPMPDITHGPSFAWLLDEAVHSLRSLGRRSILALLGIMVGSAAIALLNIGHNAAEERHARAFRQMGTDRLVVNFPIVQNARPLPATLDTAALRQAVPALSRVAPLSFSRLPSAMAARPRTPG